MKTYPTHAIRNVPAIVAHFHHEVEAPAPVLDPVVHLMKAATYRRFIYNPELPALLTSPPDFPATDARWWSNGTTSYGAPATLVFPSRRAALRASARQH